jgi:uncharacterized protein (DUF1330 family)
MIAFTEHDVEQMAAEDPDAPVVMLNLLRFAPEGGEQTYMRYLAENAAVWERHGVQPLYAGAGHPALVAEPGQEWDAVAIVGYPSRRAFLEMIRDPEYRANEHLRADSLVESVLQPTTPIPV